MDTNMMFDQENILLDIKTNSYDELINIMGKKLIDSKIINKAYLDSVLEREKQFPTGIKLDTYNVAIPHAFPQNNVYKNVIMVAKVEGICVNKMDNPLEKIEVSLVFLLALKKGDHIEILKKMFSLFQNKEKMTSLIEELDRGKIARFLNEQVC